MLRKNSIVVLDFGSQYAHLIARRIRECGAYSEILPSDTAAAKLKSVAGGIILSGGPQSVYDKGSPQADVGIFKLGIPVLGICYGHQWIAHALGGEVKPGKTKEYGQALVERMASGPASAKATAGKKWKVESVLLRGLPEQITVWMSHGDTVTKLPPGFTTVGSSPDCAVAAMEDAERNIFGVQFHLEVTHTEHGMDILQRFIELCKPAPWSIEDFAAHIGEQVKRGVGNRKVFMLVSGGVDSTVAFTLLERTLGKDRVYGLLVDTGLMRKGEVKQIKAALSRLSLDNLHVEDASDLFFQRLKGIYDPEEKRKVIGQVFLEVQRSVAKRLGFGMERVEAATDSPQGEAGWVLGQGTIYPDTIETGGTQHADRIKTHHNRVEEIQWMIKEGRVIEPLKDLYKDEVRKLGELLGLLHDLVWRHPFPGPGLGVRLLCAKEKVWPEHWQKSHKEIMGAILSTIGTLSCPYAARMLPLRSVGVQGDGRTYRHAVAIFTKADPPWDTATAVTNRVREVNRVLYCTSHVKPVEFVLTPSFITRHRADLLREADVIVDEEMRRAKLYDAIWQFPVVLLPVGLKPGGQSIVLRPVDSQEAMTANATHLPKEFLKTVTKRLLALPGIDCVFYDLTSKPPATIEWE